MKEYERYFGKVVITTDGEYEYAMVYDYTLDATKATENEGWKLTGTYYAELWFERPLK